MHALCAFEHVHVTVLELCVLRFYFGFVFCILRTCFVHAIALLRARSCALASNLHANLTNATVRMEIDMLCDRCVITEQVYAWLTIFVLPINSAINPLIYSLTTTRFRRRLSDALHSKRLGDEPNNSLNALPMTG